MAKLTVSVCATMSNLAAAMSSPSSRYDKVDSNCIRESGGANEVVGDNAVGLFIVGLLDESEERGDIHSVKKAAADFVVK